MSSHGSHQSRLSASLWQAVGDKTLQVLSDTRIDLGCDTVREFDFGIVLALPDTNSLLRAEGIVLVIETA